MHDLTSIVEGLYLKIEKLVELHKTVKEENFNLISEKQNLLNDIEKQKKIINDLVEKNKIIKLATSLTETNESSLEVKLKINEIVREIDKCIAYLNR